MLVQVIHGSTIHSYRNSLSLNKMKEFIRITFPRVRDYQIVHTITNTVVQSDADLLALKYLTQGNTLMFVVKEAKTEEQLQREMFQGMIRANLSKVVKAVLCRLQDEVCKKQTQEYLDDLYTAVIDKFIEQQEQQMIKDLIGEYLSVINEQIVSAAPKAKPAIPQSMPEQFIASQGRRVRYSVDKMRIHSDKQVQEIVSAKILQIVPDLVTKIYNSLQQQMNNGCPKCSRANHAIDELIHKQMNKHCPKRVHFEAGLANPEHHS